LFTSGEANDAYVYGITRKKWKLGQHNGHKKINKRISGLGFESFVVNEKVQQD